MKGSFEAYMINRTPSGEGTAIEFEGTFNADYVAKFVTEARGEGHAVELHTTMDPAFVRVVFEIKHDKPWIYREFYPVKGSTHRVAGVEVPAATWELITNESV